MLRQQPPVDSPVGWRSLAAAAAGALGLRRGALRQFAEALESGFGCGSVLLCDSGTSALTLALRWAADRTSRSLIALPAWGCYDLATAALASDVDVVLYDLDPITLAPDPRSLAAALEAGARTVVVVHLYGVPVDVRGVRTLPGADEVVVVEDAAQAIGAGWAGRPAGSLGDVAVLSFGRGKGVTAGRGGALLMRDGDPPEGTAMLPRRGGAAMWWDVVALAAQWILGRPRLYWMPYRMPFLKLGETVFKHPSPPRLASPVVPAAGVVALARANGETDRRRRAAARLRAAVERSPDLRGVMVPPESQPSYLRLPVVATTRTAAEAAVRSAAVRLGVARGYPRSLAELPGFGERCRNAGGEFPGASELAARLCTLPTHRWVTDSDVTRLEEWIDGSRR